MTEPEGVARAQAGQAAAPGLSPDALVERYSAMVFNLALRLTGDRTSAEDLAQDALVRAIKGLRSFRGDSDPGTWVYRITVNTWKNRVRSEKRRKIWSLFSLDRSSDEDEDKPALEVPDREPALDEPLLKRERDAAFEQAMSALDPEERAILALRELDGRSYAEIGQSLGLPSGTVKSRIHRARLALKERLKPYIHGT